MEQYLPVRKTVQEQGGRIKVRKYFIGAILSFGLILNASPAESFLNRDCANLKKRVVANQKKYEKAWDTYQTTLADWKHNKSMSSDDLTFYLTTTYQPTMNRFQQVGKLQVKIIDDMIKYPKCIKMDGSTNWPSQRKSLANLLATVDFFALYTGNYFSSIYDFTKKIK